MKNKIFKSEISSSNKINFPQELIFIKKPQPPSFNLNDPFLFENNQKLSQLIKESNFNQLAHPIFVYKKDSDSLEKWLIDRGLERDAEDIFNETENFLNLRRFKMEKMISEGKFDEFGAGYHRAKSNFYVYPCSNKIAQRLKECEVFDEKYDLPNDEVIHLNEELSYLYNSQNWDKLLEVIHEINDRKNNPPGDMTDWHTSEIYAPDKIYHPCESSFMLIDTYLALGMNQQLEEAYGDFFKYFEKHQFESVAQKNYFKAYALYREGIDLNKIDNFKLVINEVNKVLKESQSNYSAISNYEADLHFLKFKAQLELIYRTENDPLVIKEKVKKISDNLRSINWSLNDESRVKIKVLTEVELAKVDIQLKDFSRANLRYRSCIHYMKKFPGQYVRLTRKRETIGFSINYIDIYLSYLENMSKIIDHRKKQNLDISYHLNDVDQKLDFIINKIPLKDLEKLALFFYKSDLTDQLSKVINKIEEKTDHILRMDINTQERFKVNHQLAHIYYKIDQYQKVIEIIENRIIDSSHQLDPLLANAYSRQIAKIVYKINTELSNSPSESKDQLEENLNLINQAEKYFPNVKTGEFNFFKATAYTNYLEDNIANLENPEHYLSLIFSHLDQAIHYYEKENHTNSLYNCYYLKVRLQIKFNYKKSEEDLKLAVKYAKMSGHQVLMNQVKTLKKITPVQQNAQWKIEVNLSIDDIDGAINTAEKAFYQDPQDKKNLLTLANLYSQKQLYKKAIEVLNQYLANNANDLTTIYERAKNYQNLSGYHREIVKDLNFILMNDPQFKIHPSFAEAYIEVGINFFSKYQQQDPHYRKKEDLQNILALFNKAIQINPTHPVARINRGVVLSDLGQYIEAEKDFKYVVVLGTTDYHGVYAIYLLAIASKKIGREDLHKSYLKRALELAKEMKDDVLINMIHQEMKSL